ncbi:hypothetical protein OIDMADRAFT_126242, partial [Oidiodendron maius Zn]
WIPVSEGNYSGTCIFLVVLAFIFRALVSLRSVLKRRGLEAGLRSGCTIISERPSEKGTNSDLQSAKSPLKENVEDENVIVVCWPVKVVRPWRFTTGGARAVVDVMTVGVVYLLMLSIMTKNVGYFMSILCGILLGSLAVGRYGSMDEIILDG